jgi:hypothetical protein
MSGILDLRILLFRSSALHVNQIPCWRNKLVFKWPVANWSVMEKKEFGGDCETTDAYISTSNSNESLTFNFRFGERKNLFQSSPLRKNNDVLVQVEILTQRLTFDSYLLWSFYEVSMKNGYVPKIITGQGRWGW